jgi:hypothetical protein
MVPAVALVSAPRMTPFFHLIPTMVVPVEVNLGSLTPFCINLRFLWELVVCLGDNDCTFDNCQI